MEKTNTAEKIEHLEHLTASTYNQIDSAVNSSVKNYLRAIAEKNLEIIQLIYNKYETGALSEIEAKLLIEELMMSQSIGETGYVYIIDSIGVLQVHPYLTGKNINEYEFVRNQINHKLGYLSYMWKNPNDLEEKEKV
jgi:signal transduction histidine kinase